MIGQIGYTSSIESLVNYHQTKIKNGVASILESHKVQANTTSQFNASFRAYSYLNEESHPYVHISLNFHPQDKDKLTDDKYRELANEYLNHLGYQDKPFVLIKHTDQDHPHVHIITTTINDDGTKIPKFNDRYRSQNISRELELKHNLTIVSSIKENKEYVVKISNKQDLKNYLKSAIKETLALKPKRQEDFFSTLKNQYQIDSYKTKSNGISFHLFEKKGGIEIQQFEGYGVKGLSGSAINKDYSFNKIKSKLQVNFKEAPKRYRNLKLTEDKLNLELKYFKSISNPDVKELLESKGIKVFEENKKHFVIDSYGKNLYSSRDLKAFDFKIFSDKTLLDTTKINELFEEISNEAFFKYKQDVSPYLKESVFIDKIALEQTYLKYLDVSDSFKIYEPFLTSENLIQLNAAAMEYFVNKNHSVKEIENSEDNKEQEFKVLIQSFTNSNAISERRFKNLMELIDIKDQYTSHSEVRNIEKLIFAIEKKLSPEQLKEEEIFIPPNIIFQHQKYFKAEELTVENKAYYDKLTSTNYINKVYSTIKKDFISAEEFVVKLNERGIKVHIEENENGRERIYATFLESKEQVNLRGSKDFLLNTVRYIEQNAETNLNVIEFHYGLDNDNAYTTHKMYSSGNLPDDLKKVYENTEMFKEETLKSEINTFLNSNYYEYRRSFEMDYESDFLPEFSSDIDSFKEHLQDNDSNDLSGKEKYSELLEKFISRKTSKEYSSEITRKEKERFTNKFKIASQIGTPESVILLGAKWKEFKVYDAGGKYSKDFNDISIELKDLQEKPIFKYYCSIFEDVSKKVFYNQEQFRVDPNALLVYKEFKAFIPEQHIEKYEKVFAENYIKYYSAKMIALDFKTNYEKVAYLNSKGIRVLGSDDSGTDLKVVNYSDESQCKIEGIEIKNSNTDDQINYFRENGFLNENSFYKQVEFNNCIESGNYVGAAWLLKKGEARFLLHNKEIDEHGKQLEEAVKSIESTYNPTLNTAIDIANILMQKTEQQNNGKAQKGKKKKKAKKREL